MTTEKKRKEIEFDTRLVIEVFVDAKKEIEYYHSIHGITSSDIMVRVNGALKYLWDRDERKKKVEKEIRDEADRKAIIQYGITLTELHECGEVMKRFGMKTPGRRTRYCISKK